jgi:hypothetical protein
MTISSDMDVKVSLLPEIYMFQPSGCVHKIYTCKMFDSKRATKSAFRDNFTTDGRYIGRFRC